MDKTEVNEKVAPEALVNISKGILTVSVIVSVCYLKFLHKYFIFKILPSLEFPLGPKLIQLCVMETNCLFH